MTYQGSRGLRKTPKWEPKKWLSKYDLIVALYSSGVKQKVIAKQFKMTPVGVNIIIVSKQGQKLLKELQDRQRVKLDNRVESRLEDLMEQAVTNIERVINDPILINENPFAVFDRSVAVIKGLGKLDKDKEPKNGGGDKTQNNFFFNNPEIGAKIVKGLDMVAEVKRLHSGEVKNGESK